MVPFWRVLYNIERNMHAVLLGRDDDLGGPMLTRIAGVLLWSSGDIQGVEVKGECSSHNPAAFHFSDVHEPSGDPWSDARSLLWTLRCLLKLETTEK